MNLTTTITTFVDFNFSADHEKITNMILCYETFKIRFDKKPEANDELFKKFHQTITGWRRIWVITVLRMYEAFLKEQAELNLLQTQLN